MFRRLQDCRSGVSTGSDSDRVNLAALEGTTNPVAIGPGTDLILFIA